MSDAPKAPPAPLSDVEWRCDGKPNERNGNWSSRFVPYLDAATVAGLLDEWVGPARWRDSYEPGTIAGNFVLWCYLDVHFDELGWVRRSDVGKPSNWEAEKGCVSDAFKRAASLKWGVGRNVYDLPTLWAPCSVYKNKKGEDVAQATGATLPAILEQLRKLGFEAEGGRVEQPPAGVDMETGEVTAPPPDRSSAPAAAAERLCAVCDSTLVGHAVKKTADGFVHADGCPVGPGVETAA